ncbi:MAG: SNF2-related protein [Kiritimatiellaeota bacterium]|nr:SNF2-related protein [Kiritimatiellota bacterium]
MVRLEDITVGVHISGLSGSTPMSVVAVKWHGTNAMTVTFKNHAGHVAEQIVYREDENRIDVKDGNLPWSFDADADMLRLISEAYRINLAHLFDPYLAVHTSAIEPLPHQISAVYQEMLSRLPLRYILADDPGAGKTIMTGLFLKELLVRGDLKRCMIVSPGNLAEQWQDELYRKFNLRFEILTNDRIESAVTGNVFTEANLCIVRLDKLSRNEEIQEKLRVTDWDLIVCDEAHKMSATVWGGEIKYTKRFQLGRLLSSISRHFLLLTATPHNGKEEDFQLFMSLIDQDRFEGVARSGSQAVDVSDVMRRLVKEDLLKFDGTPLFPERRAYTVNYDLSPMEAKLYTAVTDYVQDEFNRADNLNNDRKNTVGFALTILQRRLASSPEAIYQSLKCRRERLENRLAEERLGKRANNYTVPEFDDYDDDDMSSAELEDTEEKVVDQASAAQTILELETEIATLKRLERMANDVRQSGEDRKWDELSKLLQDTVFNMERGRPASINKSGRDARAPEAHSRGYLPHIENRQFQFITFNLFDAIPQSVIQQWKDELKILSAVNPDSPEYCELHRRVEEYQDKGHGASFLKEPQIAEIVQNALLHFNGKRYRLVEWCIMPNHVHVLLEVFPGSSLSEIMHSWKSFTAHEANKKLNRKGDFWLPEYFDRFIRSPKHFDFTVNYIRENPVKAGLVRIYQDWQWRGSWSADVPSASLNAGETPMLHNADGTSALHKLIIFTEHRDTLRYLTDKIRSLLGNDEAVVTIHGGLLRDERRKVEELFKQDKEVRILIATDAAGEGINLQRAHLMVNYDLPWNPNRLEQRFGRIHRIGQTEVCHLWNLVSRETREGMVFQRLFEKLEQEREALKGKVFDVLGKVTFENKPLRDLLIEAIRYGNDPAVRDRLNQVVDHSLDREELQRLMDEHALTEDALDVHQVISIREDMERMEVHKLQPHFIEAFFLEAFQNVGGKIRAREKGRYEITSVPFAVRNRDMQIGFGEPVLSRYERVCFDKSYCNLQGLAPAALIAPGHPLLEAVIDLVRERNVDVLKRGAVFIDDNDFGTEARLLFYVEDSVQDGVIMPNGSKRVISKNIHFVEIKEDGTAVNAGYAPYLDYRAAKEDEQSAVRTFLNSQQWLQANVEDIAVGYAISQVIPAHVAEVRERKTKLIDKTAKAVKERLTAEIQYWDFRAADLKTKESAGKTNAKLNSHMASRRAEELESRMQKRLAELETEKLISAMPPVIVGGALVIPCGLLNKLMGKPDSFAADAVARREIELAAMKAVMDIETSLGYIPVDVSAAKVGYDVESQIPLGKRDAGGTSLRFIEVKGRAAGASTVTVSKNEILMALNKPDEYMLAIVEVWSADVSSALQAGGTPAVHGDAGGTPAVHGDAGGTPAVHGDAGGTPAVHKVHNVVYLKKPFRERPDFAATSVNFNIMELVNGSEIHLQRG